MDTTTMTMDEEYAYLSARVRVLAAKIFERDQAIEKKQKAEVIALAKKKPAAFKKQWKKMVEQENLIENIQMILTMCYENLKHTDCTKSEVVSKNAEALGKVGSKEWREFLIKLIGAILEDDGFGNAEDGYENFEDTAGGCDESVWAKAVELLS
jgi:hypothetical protein